MYIVYIEQSDLAMWGLVQRSGTGHINHVCVEFLRGCVDRFFKCKRKSMDPTALTYFTNNI